jgi:hypothetical protein
MAWVSPFTFSVTAIEPGIASEVVSAGAGVLATAEAAKGVTAAAAVATPAAPT